MLSLLVIFTKNLIVEVGTAALQSAFKNMSTNANDRRFYYTAQSLDDP
jgi:hypothetical protein